MCRIDISCPARQNRAAEVIFDAGLHFEFQELKWKRRKTQIT